MSESCKKRDNREHLSTTFWMFRWVLSRLAPGWGSLHRPPAVVGTEVALQVDAHLAVQRGVDERVVASWAHGHQVAAHLEDVDEALSEHVEVWVQVQQQVQNLHKEHGETWITAVPGMFLIRLQSVLHYYLNVRWSRTHSLTSVKLDPNLRTAESKYKILIM